MRWILNHTLNKTLDIFNDTWILNQTLNPEPWIMNCEPDANFTSVIERCLVTPVLLSWWILKKWINLFSEYIFHSYMLGYPGKHLSYFLIENVWYEYSLAPIYCISITRLFKYIEKFTSKNWKFSDKKLCYFIFQISAQNRDCGRSMELPQRGRSNEYQ